MTSAILAELAAQVEATKSVEASATALISGFATRLQEAISSALANGATEAELAPIQDEINSLKASSDALAAAVAANP